MRKWTLTTFCSAALLGLLVAGCGGPAARTATPAPQQPGPAPAMPALPAPAELLKSASAIEDGDRWLEGNAYAPALPHAHVDDPNDPFKKSKQASAYSFGLLTFAPNWDPDATTSAADIAYAIYEFGGFDTYQGQAELYTGWSNVQLDKVWLGLANFSTNRWDWFNSPVDPEIDLPGFAPYTAADGRLFLVVLLLGTQAADLNWVLAGEPIQPVADLDSDLENNPLQRIAPLSVNFDASYSYTVGTHISEYALDFDGDGAYDAAGSDTAFSHTYGPGDYTMRLRITDNRGQVATDEYAFHVINPANQMPTASFTPIITTNNAPLTVNFDASMSSDPDGSIIRYDWDFDSDGDIDYTSSTPDATYTFCTEGANNVKLTVTDNDLATDEEFGQVVCNNGWRRKVVASGNGLIGREISATVQGSGVNARACIAFSSTTNRSLYFVRSNSSIATGWEAAVKVMNGDANYGYTSSPSIAVEQMTQTPCIAFGASGPTAAESGLFFIRSTNAMGTAWNAPVAVDTGTAAGDVNRLQQPGGTLTIANIAKSSYQGGSALRVFQATDALGATWGAATTLDSAEPGEQITQLSMFSASGVNPLLAWTSILSSQTAYQTCRSTTLNGSAWGNSIAVPKGAGQNTDQIGIGLAGGFPAMCFGSTSQGSALWYARADDAAASAWSTVPAQLDSGWTGGYCTMATVSGAPAIAYYNVSPQQQVMYIQAADANGSSWNTPQIVDSMGNVGSGLTMCVLPNNIPLIVYTDNTNLALKSAVLF